MKMLHLISTGFAACFLFASVSIAASNVTVPIWQDIDGRARVTITVEDGRNFDFVIDTGMMNTVVMPELVEALSLARQSEDNTRPAISAIKVIIGGKIPFLIKSPTVLSNMKISEETVYGILGSEFLQMYTIGLDLGAGIMVLSDSSAEDIFDDSEFAKVPMYSPFANLWMTEKIQIGQEYVTGFLDTGANKTFINPVAIKKLDPDLVSTSPTQKGTARTGSSNAVAETYGAVIRQMRVGARLWRDQDVLVTEGIFSQLRLAKIPAMVLGADVLLSRRIILDYQNRFVYFELD